MQINVFIGTVAELIKLIPVIRELQHRGTPFRIIASGQNDLRNSDLWPELAGCDILWLSDIRISQNPAGLLRWFVSTFFKGIRLIRKQLRAEGCVKQRLMLVHGDTVSTLMGAVLARLFRFKLCHVEAGLRSFKLMRPFPEEICRIWVSHLARVAYCPNEWALNNLGKFRRVERVNTQCNTLYDAMQEALVAHPEHAILSQLPETFFLFVLHRQENLFDRKFVRKMMDEVHRQADRLPCVIVLHKPMEVVLDQIGLKAALLANPAIYPVSRLPYRVFTRLLEKAAFIVTDGGSNQEEAFFLGKPCLILRRETERIEGLGENAVLSGKSVDCIQQFLADPSLYRRAPVLIRQSPSVRIVDHLLKSSGS